MICDSCVVKLQQSVEFKVLCAEVRGKRNVPNNTKEICGICLKVTKLNCSQDNVSKMYIDVLLKKYIPDLVLLQYSDKYFF